MDKELFASQAAVPPDTKNRAGGRAYKMSPKESLAQLAATGFLADTFYTKASDQLDELVGWAAQCDDEFVGQVALYARHAGFMKDSPAVLMAYLFGKGSDVVPTLFPQVIDNVKMLSNFVRCVRSAKFGRRSLGTRGKRLIREWLDKRSNDYLVRSSIAKDPSLGDIIKLSHPRPKDPQRDALYGYLTDKLKDKQLEALPPLLRDVLDFREAAKVGDSADFPVPNVPFNMIDSVPLTPAQWGMLFERGGYMFTRMNLNTALRQGALKGDLINLIAQRLSNKEEVIRARQFPYQLLMAHVAASSSTDMPQKIKSALHLAMEHATRSVPAYTGNVYIAVDCSGSMSSPVTGYRDGATTAVSYSTVAALFAACVLRNSPDARIMTFADRATFVPVDSDDTVITTARMLASAGGGTDCSSPLRLLNEEKRDVDLFVLISDGESWLDSPFYYHSRRGTTGTVSEWAKLKKRCPGAKQVRINISPNATDQLPKRPDTLRIGGFSDAVFTAMANFAEGRDWVKTVEAFTV
jgi:60 kDa SS-A/Ro ribonucleoprotein